MLFRLARGARKCCSDSLGQGRSEVPVGLAALGSDKAHVLMLYPLLCQVITTKEAEVRALLRDLLLEIAGVVAGATAAT